MNNGMSKDNSYGWAQLSLATSLILLLLHIYFYYYAVFDWMGWTTIFTDRFLGLIIKTGLFNNVYFSKGSALVFLWLSIWGSPVRKSPEIRLKYNLILLSISLLIYLICMPVVFSWKYTGRTALVLYTAFTAISWALIFVSSSSIIRRFKLPWSGDDPFGRRRAGFPQEQALLSSDFSLHLRGSYSWQGQQRKSWINFINPRRGILIMGSPGSGKSWFIIEPFIRQLIEKQFALFIYDFKYDSLTKLAWSHFQANKHKYPENTVFYSINFTNLSRSHRCNVLDPSTLNYLSDALGASRTILLSMNKTWVHRQGDFFIESPINFVAALIWYLRKYKNGKFCTLPHVIELSKIPYDKLFTLLEAESEIATLIDPFIQAYNNKTTEMLDGQVAGAKIPLGRLSSPELYYILTGNDFKLDINNPAAPKIFCLGGDPSRIEALAPVISLYIDRLTQICNQPEQYPCALVCDEFASIRAYNMATTIATGRSNDIVPILAIQDIAQLQTQYSKQEAATILNICGNLLCGQAGGETARWVSDRFPKILQDRSSISVNSSDTSINTSQQWEPTVTQATVSTLSSGEFLGITADEPGKELELKTFHTRIIGNKDELSSAHLPVIRRLSAGILQEQYNQIKQDIEKLVAEELGRIAGSVPIPESHT